MSRRASSLPNANRATGIRSFLLPAAPGRVYPGRPRCSFDRDNYATHKHAKVRTWLARRSRYHIHYTPTYSSWLNQVERWFGLITQQSIRRGPSEALMNDESVKKIDSFVQHYNRW
jgi:hypothetical protein